MKTFIKKMLLNFGLYNNSSLVENIAPSNKIFFRNVDFVNSLVGEYTYVANNTVISETTIGRFCSIGPNCVIGFGDHPKHLISTSPVFYSSKTDFDLKPKIDLFNGHEAVSIGSDVWIGANVFIKNGVKVGHGAIIGAGSIVLHDVEPYSIVVGTPGKHKSYRFSEKIIAELLEIEWWNFPIDIIKENFELFTSPNIIDNLDEILNLKPKL